MEPNHFKSSCLFREEPLMKKVLRTTILNHHHDVRCKSLTLESYVQCEESIRFASFFILNATQLETIRIKFLLQEDFTEQFYKQQQEVLQWDKKASKHDCLRLSPSCNHKNLDLRHAHVEHLDLKDPFTCKC